MKQEKQSFGHRNHNPSEVTEISWIYARRSSDTGYYPDSTEFGDEWLIFLDINILDEKWKLIREVTV